MRPEIEEYNFDFLMGGTLNAAASLAQSTPKEFSNCLNYLPSYRDVVQSFYSIGDTGGEILHFLSDYYENILTARAQGKKLALTSFSLYPVLLYAMDVVPVAIELLTTLGNLVWERGTYDYMDHASEAGLPETSCSAQRGAIGAYLARLGEEADFILYNTPGSCDTNANAYAFSASYLDKPFYQLNQPSNLADDYHLKDYQSMVDFLEEQTGKKLDYDRLAELLKETDKQDRLIAELEDMQLMRPNPFSSLYTLGIYAGQIAFAGHEKLTRFLEVMVRETRKRVEMGLSGLKSGKEKLRAFVCYIDHYTQNTRFWEWLDERGISHMGIMAKSFRDTPLNIKNHGDVVYGIDTSSPETMLNSVAQLTSRVVMIREMRGPYDAPGMWLEETLTLADMYQADCFIFNTTLGCRNTWGIVKMYAREIEKRGYPIHIMNDDAWDDRVESWDMTRDRLDEFLKVRNLL